MSYIIKMGLDIKARFHPPAAMTSPLEAYCALGVISKAMGLNMPERKDTLFEMRDALTTALNNREPENDRIAGILLILTNYIRNAQTSGPMMEYVAYGYEHES